MPAHGEIRLDLYRRLESALLFGVCAQDRRTLKAHMILTQQQTERMSVLMDGAKVVGSEDECPVIIYGNGQMRRVTKEGRVVAPSKIAQDRIMRRMVARWERDEHG